MKNSIYFSATLALAFLSIRFVGLFLDLTYNDLILMIGSGILLFITLPLYLYERHRYLQKKRDILKTFEKKNEMVKNKKKKTEQQPDYPSFRSQKSGLTWSGGNVHGARAKRGSKKGFIKH